MTEERSTMDGMVVKPYRIVAKIKNNRLWRAILERFPEVKTQTDAARFLEVDSNMLGRLLNMRVLPKRNGKWSAPAIRIATALRETEEYLFDPDLYGQTAQRQIELECDPRDVAMVSTAQPMPLPDAVYDQKLLSERVHQALRTLTQREERVLKFRFGIDEEGPLTLDEIGKRFDVTKERIRDIESRAMCKLRHPRRAKYLKAFAEC